MIKNLELNNLKQAKQELETKNQNYEEKMVLYKKRMRILEINQFKERAVNILAFSLLVYFLQFLFFTIFFKNVINVILTIIPALYFPIILIVFSLFTGILINALLEKKYQTKKKLRTFSTAKTQVELFEEEINNQIDLEKLTSKHLVITNAINILNSKEELLKNLSNEYDIIKKSTSDNCDKENLKVKILSTLIKEYYNKLDILSTQKILHDRFWKIRTKFYSVQDTFFVSIVSGTFSMLCVSFPFILVAKNIETSFPLITTSAIIFTPFILGIVGAIVYIVIRNKKYKKVFNNINSKLGKNALPNIQNNEEQEKLKESLEIKIRDTSMAMVKLKEELNK